MPLLLPTLTQEFLNVLDKNAPGFVGYPADAIQAADNWSNIFFNYVATIVPVSSSGASAKSALQGILAGAYAGNFITLLESGLPAFASALAVGMAPTFAGVAPTGPISFAPVLALPLGSPVSAIANAFANTTHTWFLTGTWTNNSTYVTGTWL